MAEQLCFIGSTFPARHPARIYLSIHTNQFCEDLGIVRFFCGVLTVERYLSRVSGQWKHRFDHRNYELC